MDDARGAIAAAENALRDLIADVLAAKLGNDWFAASGLSDARRAQALERRDEEAKRRQGGIVETRELYYANIEDLGVIIARQNWEDFKPIFGDKKTFEVYLDRMTDFRNPEMHGRDLLPFEVHLVLGITGELRNKITLHLSSRTDVDRYFPRIERVIDSFGRVATSHQRVMEPEIVLHPGDVVTFRCEGWDPEGHPLSWWFTTSHPSVQQRLDGDTFDMVVNESHIGELTIFVFMRGDRPYARKGSYDDSLHFEYLVLPARPSDVA